MYIELCYIFLLFVIYSFAGYLVEVFSVSITQKKIIFSRGYLIGPYLPIFGVGSMIVTLFLKKYQNDILALFIMTVVFCCIIEYFTSLILEKLFNLRWWDYSKNKFNLNGRICLEVGVLFGVGGIFIIKIFNPIVFNFLGLINKNIIMFISTTIFIIMIIDFIVSTIAVIKLKIDTSKYKNLDATNIIKEEVRKSLNKYNYFYKRIIKAFPEISKNNKNIIHLKEIIDKTKEQIKNNKTK